MKIFIKTTQISLVFGFILLFLPFWTSAQVATSPQITTAGLPQTSIGHSYYASLQAINGVSPYSWSIISGSLPDGLSLNPSTGEITGTPTVMGNFNIQVQVTDSSSQSSNTNLTISVSDGNQIGACNWVALTKHPYTDWGGGGWLIIKV